MDVVYGLLRFFQEGGAFMVPIAIVLAAGTAIAIERYLYLSRVDGANNKSSKTLLPMLQQGKLRELVTALDRDRSVMAEILRGGVERLPGVRRRSDIEYALEEGLLDSLPRIERRTPYLATLANLATLLGLLGTIIGLIAAFTAVANADPSQKATMLSQSISVAMNTTAFGLMAAIPLLFVHAYLQSRTRAIVEMLEGATVKFLNGLEKRLAEAKGQPLATDTQATNA